MSEADKWRLRERALAGGLLGWAFSVSAMATFRPEQLVSLLTETSPPVLAGGILISAGLAGGFVETVLIAIDAWATPENSELTEWDK